MSATTPGFLVAGRPREQPRSLGLPPLAGVCSYEEAGRVGYSIEENVRLLKRFLWVQSRLSELICAHITATPEWEAKEGLSLHFWLCAEHSKALRARVAEMRHPPHNFDRDPDPELAAWMAEALCSEDTVELLSGIYGVVLPALLEAERRHGAETNPLFDHPTRRQMRFIIQEQEEMLEWGRQSLAALTEDDEEAAARAEVWRAHLTAYLAAAGGLHGEDARPAAPLPAARATAPFEPDFTPRRDERFESFNYNFPPHWVYIQPERPASERIVALICKRLLEMDVPEMMTAIIWRRLTDIRAEGREVPWDYVADMSRQLWDEARHSMMGQVWLQKHGIDWTRLPLNVGFSLGLNQLCTADEAHAALWWIEQGLMPRTTGKAYEWRTAGEAKDPFATFLLDYDWADEVLHVHIGRRWLVKRLGGRDEVVRQGEEAFSRVMAVRREAGLAGAKEVPQSDWWTPFCERLLGFTPEPLEEEMVSSSEHDAPWASASA